jgi:hypothetical protein
MAAIPAKAVHPCSQNVLVDGVGYKVLHCMTVYDERCMPCETNLRRVSRK